MYPRRGETRNLSARNRRDMSSPASFRIDDDYGYPFSRRIISRAILFQPVYLSSRSARKYLRTIHTIEILDRESAGLYFIHFPQNFRTARDLRRSICVSWPRKGIQEASVLKIQHKCLRPFANVTRRKINSTLYSTVTRLIWSGILCNTNTQWYDYYSRIMRVTVAFINI